MWMAYAAGAMVLYTAGMITGYLAGQSRRERTLFDTQIDAFEQKIESNRAPRHAARSPRGTPGGAMVPGESPGQPPTHRPVKQHPPASSRLARDPGGPWYRKHPAPGTGGTIMRAAVTAADITPVFLPAPGVSIPLRPQPGRDSGDGTVTMPKITDTGSMRAATDKFIARLQRDGDAYREGLTA